MDYGSQIENWYVMFVKTGDEDNVKERVKYRLSENYRVLVPKRLLRERKGGIWSVEKKVLFPGYIMLQGELNTDSYYNLKNIPNLIRLLKTGNEIKCIESREVSVLSRLICNSEEIGFSSVLKENEKITVVDGPLFSLEGLIISIDHRKGRAKVKLTFLGEERVIDLGVSVLKAV